MNIKDNRYNFLDMGSDYTAYQIFRGPPWKSKLKIDSYNTMDGGREKFHTVFGAYYFYDNVVFESTRTVQNWFDVLGIFGGLQGLLIIVFQTLIGKLNDTKFTAKQIRQLFVTEQSRGTQVKPNVKLSCRSLFDCCCCKRREAEYWEQGEEMLENQLDLLKVLKSIKKM